MEIEDLHPKNHEYSNGLPWIFGNPCMDMLCILGPGVLFHVVFISVRLQITQKKKQQRGF